MEFILGTDPYRSCSLWEKRYGIHQALHWDLSQVSQGCHLCRWDISWADVFSAEIYRVTLGNTKCWRFGKHNRLDLPNWIDQGLVLLFKPPAVDSGDFQNILGYFSLYKLCYPQIATPKGFRNIQQLDICPKSLRSLHRFCHDTRPSGSSLRT